MLKKDVLDLLNSVSDIPTPNTYSNYDDKSGTNMKPRSSIGFITNDGKGKVQRAKGQTTLSINRNNWLH